MTMHKRHGMSGSVGYAPDICAKDFERTIIVHLMVELISRMCMCGVCILNFGQDQFCLFARRARDNCNIFCRTSKLYGQFSRSSVFDCIEIYTDLLHNFYGHTVTNFATIYHKNFNAKSKINEITHKI